VRYLYISDDKVLLGFTKNPEAQASSKKRENLRRTKQKNDNAAVVTASTVTQPWAAPKLFRNSMQDIEGGFVIPCDSLYCVEKAYMKPGW
jgi:hypothetical protein